PTNWVEVIGLPVPAGRPSKLEFYGSTSRHLKIEKNEPNSPLYISEVQAWGTSYDDTDPTMPSAFTATAGSARVDLSWVFSSDNVGVRWYHIEKCSGAGCTDFHDITSTPTQQTTFGDTRVGRGILYRYRAYAMDYANNVSPYTDIVEATPL